jgi:hypothetical protein
MKITKHICFFYTEHRIYCINNIIDETNTYPHETDLFIHTNKLDLSVDAFHNYTNGNIHIIHHDLSGIDPFYLTWKYRDVIKSQRDDYDIFIYIEEDMLVPKKALNYWIENNEKLIENNFNLGFVRIEFDENNEEYITDLYGEYLTNIITLDGNSYCLNDKNPYCAFWIYNKKEFSRFVDSKYYDITSFMDSYDMRAASAIGMHGIQNYCYKGTLIPIVNNKLIDDCKIYHMPNNYVTNKDTPFATIKFNDAFKL